MAAGLAAATFELEPADPFAPPEHAQDDPPPCELTAQAMPGTEDAAGPLLAALGYAVRYARDPEDARQAVAELLESPALLFGVDIETGGLDPLAHRTRCVQIADDRHAVVFDLDTVPPDILAPLFRSGGNWPPMTRRSNSGSSTG